MDASSRAYRFHGRRIPGDVQPRARSARLRGVKAPCKHSLRHPQPQLSTIDPLQPPDVRTSLSPDLVLRQRRRRPRRLRESCRDEVIEISSDSDTESGPANVARPRRTSLPPPPPLPARRSRSTPSPADSGAVIDPPRGASGQLAVDATRPRPISIRQDKVPRHQGYYAASIATTSVETSSQFTTGSSRQTRAWDTTRLPSWIRVCIQDIRKTFSNLGVDCDFREVPTPSGGNKWEIVCILCNPDQSFETGPGRTLDAFGYHVRKFHYPHPHAANDSTRALQVGVRSHGWHQARRI